MAKANAAKTKGFGKETLAKADAKTLKAKANAAKTKGFGKESLAKADAKTAKAKKKADIAKAAASAKAHAHAQAMAKAASDAAAVAVAKAAKEALAEADKKADKKVEAKSAAEIMAEIDKKAEAEAKTAAEIMAEAEYERFAASLGGIADSLQAMMDEPLPHSKGEVEAVHEELEAALLAAKEREDSLEKRLAALESRGIGDTLMAKIFGENEDGNKKQ